MADKRKTPSQPAFHEDLGRDDVVAAPTEKSFGITFAVVALLLALWVWWRKDMPNLALVFLAASAAFLAAGFVAPALLRPLNLVWLKFGLLLHKVINPVVMGLLFFLVFTPMGLIMRAFGKDFLRLKFRAEGQSYWVSRSGDGSVPTSMRNQF
ncbi:hypothetical protein BH10PSE7_BH10PSE7_28610 [soil metagenome]